MIPKVVLLGHDVSVFSDIGSRLVFPPPLLHRWLSFIIGCMHNEPQTVNEERNKERFCIFIYKNDGYDSKNEVWLVEMRSSLRLGP